VYVIAVVELLQPLVAPLTVSAVKVPLASVSTPETVNASPTQSGTPDERLSVATRFRMLPDVTEADALAVAGTSLPVFA
jgi:hypothetical protein